MLKRQLKNLPQSLKQINLKLKSLFEQTEKTNRIYSPAIKTLTLFLIFALMFPLVFFGDWSQTAAQLRPFSFSESNSAVPDSAPPLPYDFSGSSNEISLWLGETSLAGAVSDSASAIRDFITPPPIPNGFEIAQNPSPLSQMFLSAISSAGLLFDPIFGLFFSAETSTAPTAPALTVNSSVQFDYDNDNLADLSVYQPSNGVWKIKNSNGGTFTNHTMGMSNSLIAPGDFNNDGKTDMAVFDSGVWTIKPSGGSQYTVSWGLLGDKPVVGDYDGDGKSDVAVFRPSTNTWWVLKSSNGSYTSKVLGAAGDITVQGDYDGDGKTDYAVFRPSNGYWYVSKSSNGATMTYGWGIASDTPVPGDYDGDGKTDYAVYRPTTGTWYATKSSGGAHIQVAWGNYGDQPVAADYDGDGKTDVAVWRPKTGTWYVINSSDGSFLIEALGVAGDVPTESAYLKQIGGAVQEYDFAKLRLSPKESTGGTDLYSRNFSWGTGLVGLPGRAGLDAGFGISYNSLVWIKYGSVMYFDPDASNVAPGFRIGFPTIEPAYYDSTTSQFSYLMVTPSGARVEFQQTAASNVYETVDSSYVQLKTNGSSNPNDPYEDITITVTGTNGSQMEYEWTAGAYRCKQIKDRNGNFITITYNAYGQLATVKDTLNRVITVNYDSEQSPTTITQSWKTNNGSGSATTHTYATFAYVNKTINPGFSPTLAIYGPQGASVRVLDKVIYGTTGTGNNTGETRFEYNDFGQVKKVRNYSPNGILLNYVETNLETPGTNQQDVPRLTQTRSWVKNFNLGQNGNEQEVVIENRLTTGHTISVAGQPNESASLIQVEMLGHPHGNITNTYVGDSGWKEGLPILTDDYTVVGSSLLKKRWSWSKWTQDNTSLSYIKNPRVIQTRVGDEENSNQIRTEIDYLTTGALANFGLTKEVRIYDHNLNALKKRSVLSYNENSAYTSRRIIGLPSQNELYDGNGYLMSKVTYNYDEGNFNDSTLDQSISPIQHDSAYNSSFILGRGNLTSVTRHDVTNSNTITSSSLKYNTAGAVVAQTTPWREGTTKTITIDYADNFNDGGNSRGTYAYPKTVTDPAGYSSTVMYRFDVGANVRAESPAPVGAQYGKITERKYDNFGRMERESIYKGTVEHAYTRYVYPTNQTEFVSFSTLTAGTEFETRTYTDGAGRTIKSKSEHPGSSTLWRGSLVEYDILGRVTRSSVPAEIDGNWNPAGDDAATGWRWQSQEYDWRNRITRQIKTDGDPNLSENDSDIRISYSGCGCAGGQITTIEGEKIVERDWNGNITNTLGRRTQKIYQDVLGRAYKTEILNWNGSAYSRTETQFNGRDQATSVTQTEIATSKSQLTTMTYDGYGRLKTRKLPQQDAATSYNYNPDDSIKEVTDARGAKTIYTFNRRGLLRNIDYAAPDDPNNPGTPDPNVPVPGGVFYIYDDAGNLMTMYDELGYVSYNYNELSQMTSETRNFNDTLANAPETNNGFTLTYSYTLSGQLKSIKDPFDDQINYTHDEAGRLTSVDGAASFGNVTNYADTPHYRAWGGLQSLEYGNGLKMEMTFNDRLQAETFKLTDSTTQAVHMDKSYEYYSDGKLRKLNDNKLYDTYGGTNVDAFDRAIKYDHVGRPKEGTSSAEARGGTVAPADMEAELPYRQSYEFNAFGNMTKRDNKHWGVEMWYGESNNLSYTYQNNRITNGGWEHDADGRVTKSSYPDQPYTNTYDVRGQITRIFQTEGSDLSRFYDGNGREVKRERKNWDATSSQWIDQPTEYFIRSSVLGGAVVSEVGSTGRKKRTFVRAAGTVLAWQNQSFYNNQEDEYVNFNYADASGLSHRSANKDGDILNHYSAEGAPAELDPLGANVGLITPYITLSGGPPPETPMLHNMTNDDHMIVNGQRVPCMADGMAISCGIARSMLENGSLVPEAIGMIMNAAARMGVDLDMRYEGFGRYTMRDYRYDAHARIGLTFGYPSDFWSQQKQTKEPTPLSGDDLKNWKIARDRLLDLLLPYEDLISDCRKYLENAGFDVEKIIDSLLEQTPYDAFKSLNDANLDFGSYGQTVKDFLSQLDFDAAASAEGRIFYNTKTGSGYSVAVILHETLHIVFKGKNDRFIYNPETGEVSKAGKRGLSDDEIKTKLNLPTNSNTTRDITKALEDNGCKNIDLFVERK